MLRRIAGFLIWLGFFGMFLSVAAYSTGTTRPDLILGSAALIAFSVWVLRKRGAPFEPTRRFRTLRRLGLVGSKGEESKEN